MPQPFRGQPLYKNKDKRDPSIRIVRLKTINPKRGIHMRRWGARWKGKDYEIIHGEGWYAVPVSLARYLETVPTRHGANPGAEGDEDMACAFVIKETVAEAEAYDEREQKKEVARVEKNPSLRINDLTGGSGRSSARAQRFDELEPDEREQEDPDERQDRDRRPRDEDDEEARRERREKPRDDDRDDGEIDEEIEALERRKKELLAAKGRKGEKKETPRDKELDNDKQDEEDDEEEDEEEQEENDDPDNPDINRGDLSTVDFRAEGDRPRPARSKKKKAEEKPKANTKKDAKKPEREPRALRAPTAEEREKEK